MPTITDDEINDALRQAAIDPQQFSADGQSVTRGNPRDIAFVQDRAETRDSLGSTGSGWGGLRPARVKPPGSC